MRTSDSIDQISAALSAAQGAFTNPERNREVKTTSYSFSYSTLDVVMDSVRAPMSKNGLSIIQAAEMSEGLLVVTTRIAHASGQWLESDLCAKPADLSPQKIGSVITYLRRYSICALLGLASEEDDDGNMGAAQTSEKPKAQPKAKPVEQSKPAEKSTYELMQERILLHSGNDQTLADMAEWIGDTTKHHMPPAECDRLIAKIMRARKALEAVAEPALRH